MRRAALQNKAYTPARRQLSILAESFGDHGTVADALSLLTEINRSTPLTFVD